MKEEQEDKPLKFLLSELKPIYPEIETNWTRSQLYGLLLKKADAGGKLQLSVDFMNSSDTTYLMQETLTANKHLCKWTFWLTFATSVMALATFWMARSTEQMANAKAPEPQIGYRFDALTGDGYPILLRKLTIVPKVKK
ncbi:MAG: hypothetical protein QG574_5235 [Cyanobacteriota bacterium erpe_2018_sw_21hr_WHONDRS-SW48-000092_B_bin.40]|jgi:hypothetical protein|nr:hypothetical protein [Cyanobacteriota bacterium erpe_2018_sw_21hr_WHONDRS-SW48-000092_B_bin.40]